jgi:hypothetical protein
MTTDTPRLDPGERLIWSGRPHALRYAMKKGGFVFLFGIPWTIMCAAGFPKAMAKNETGLLLVAILFTAVGFFLLSTPFWQAWRAARTRYVLTDRRAVVDTAPPFAQRLTMPLDRVSFVELRKSSSGFGDVNFKDTATAGGDGPTITREGFIAIPGAEEVEQLFRNAMARATPRTREGP